MATTKVTLEAVEDRYHVKFPSSYRKIVYSPAFDRATASMQSLEVGNCNFYNMRMLLAGSRRCGELPTGLFPFAKENGDDYCFWFGQVGAASEPAIVVRLGETHHLFPIASSLRGLMWQALTIEEDILRHPAWADQVEKSTRMMRQISKTLDLPPTPGMSWDVENKKKLFRYYMKYLQVDPMGAQILCWVGKYLVEKGKKKEAGEYFSRSIRVAPYLAAPYLLLADLRQNQGKTDEALHLRWNATSCPLYSSGYTYWTQFSLGIEEDTYLFDEGSIFRSYAVLRENEEKLQAIAGDDPLAEYVLSKKPSDQEARVELAATYQESGDLIKADREWNNVLFLACFNDGALLGEALESLKSIHRELGHKWAIVMHNDRVWL